PALPGPARPPPAPTWARPALTGPPRCQSLTPLRPAQRLTTRPGRALSVAERYGGGSGTDRWTRDVGEGEAGLQDVVEHGLGQTPGLGVLLRDVVAPHQVHHDAVRPDQLGAGRVPEAWRRPRDRPPHRAHDAEDRLPAEAAQGEHHPHGRRGQLDLA